MTIRKRQNNTLGLTEEEVLIQLYQPEVKLIGKADLAVDEYIKHLEYFERNINCNLTPDADKKIVRAMIEQGYEKKELGRLIAEKSPCAPSLTNEAREYGKKILKEVERGLKREEKNQGIRR